MKLSDYDSQEIYCRKLGHHLKFAYCRQERLDKTCSAISECWQNKIPIPDLLAETRILEIRDGRSAKISTIMNIVEQVRIRTRQE